MEMEMENIARKLAGTYILAIKLAFPNQNVEIMARGVLIEEIKNSDSGTIDFPNIVE